MFRRTILAVCTGNTCRSPMVEAIIRQKLGFWGRLRYRVISAGTNAKNGDIVSRNSVEALKDWGIDISTHRAKELKPKMVKKAYLIIGLSESHRATVLSMDLRAIVRVLNVSDPFGRSIDVYRNTRDEIANKVAPLIAILRGRYREIVQRRLSSTAA